MPTSTPLIGRLASARLSALGGFASSRDLTACGLTSRTVDRLVRDGRLARVRKGAFVDASLLERADPRARRRLRNQAVIRSLTDAGQPVAGSHASALAVLDLPVLDPGSDYHLCHTVPGTATVDGDLHVHRCLMPDSVVLHGVLPIMRPEVAIVAEAMTHGVEAGLVACDAALHADLTTIEDIRRIVGSLPGRPGIRQARMMVELAEPQTESPGETLTRIQLIAMGEPFDVQVTFPLRGGRARVDFLLRRWKVIIEFDGLVKYAGADGPDALAQEKAREDALRDLGYEVVRVVWDDLLDPRRLTDLVRHAIRRAAARG